MNDGGVVVHYLFNLDRGLCDFSTAAASVLMRVLKQESDFIKILRLFHTTLQPNEGITWDYLYHIIPSFGCETNEKSL